MRRLAVLILGLATVPGCAFFKQPANVEATRVQVEELRREQAELTALIRELNDRLARQDEVLSTLRADASLTWDEIGSRMTVLQSQLQDQGTQFERMNRRPDPRPRPGVTTSVDTLGGPEVAGDTAFGDDARGMVVGGGSGTPPASAADLYDAAYRDLSRGSYSLALSGFRDFLRYYPDTELSDNAQYWVGECYYGMGDLDQAILEYLKVRDLHPGADKVPAATLKAGYAFLRKGDIDTARRYFDSVVREYPGSDEAGLARDKLETLR